MKIIIDGYSGEWAVYMEMSDKPGVFKTVELSECSRIEINSDSQHGVSVSLVRKDNGNVNSQPNDKL